MPDPVAAPGAVPGTPGWRHAPRAGVVVAFDQGRGLGTVEDGSGRQVPFHCTALVDGSRRVEVGTAVWFTLAAGHHGRIEAGAVAAVPASASGATGEASGGAGGGAAGLPPATGA